MQVYDRLGPREAPGIFAANRKHRKDEHAVIRTLCYILVILIGISAQAQTANQVTLIEEAPIALKAFKAAIESAQSSIEIADFIFDPCDTSTKILISALVKKAREGKSVRLVLDAYDLSISDRWLHKDPRSLANLAAFFKHTKIKARFFNQINPLMLFNADSRLHMKILIVDGKKAIVGSRNFGDEHFGLRAQFNYTDRDLLLEGPVVKKVRRAFRMLWQNRLTKEYETDGRIDPDWRRSCFGYGAREKAVTEVIESTYAEKLASLPTRQCRNVYYVNDDPNFSSDMQMSQKYATKAFLNFISGARQKLQIENWAYEPSDFEREVLSNLRRRKVSIEVLTNRRAFAGGSFNHALDDEIAYFANADSRESEIVMQISPWGRFSGAWERTPSRAPFGMHEKIAIRDSRDVTVGSFNFDSRSYGINLEDIVIIDDCPELESDLNSAYSKVRATFLEDFKSCPRCRQNRSDSFADQLKGFLAHTFL
jgi:putative cardiolipin synthase